MLLARSTDSQLARQVEFLHAENQMLRRRLAKRVRLNGHERALLVRLGEAIGGRAVRVLLTVVSYPTYRRYVGQVDPTVSGTPCVGSQGGSPAYLGRDPQLGPPPRPGERWLGVHAHPR
jgi:hypothetical protein